MENNERAPKWAEDLSAFIDGIKELANERVKQSQAEEKELKVEKPKVSEAIKRFTGKTETENKSNASNNVSNAIKNFTKSKNQQNEK